MVSGSTEQPPPFDELRFTEDFAAVMSGFPPIAGRILGLLLVTDEPALSSRQLMDRLGVSSASVSNMGRLLVQAGMVDRTVSPETRRDLFSIRPGVWTHQFRAALENVHQSLGVLEGALAHRRSGHDRSWAKLMEMRDYYVFLGQELPLLVERFEKWRAEQGRDG